jgi:uncharacterized protein (DUF983 family)
VAPTALQVALFHRCPACGKGSIYAGILRLAERCPDCGLSLRAHDSGDGPAFFAITLLGFVVVGFATWIEFTFRPPFWVTLLASAAMIALLTPLSLRFFKSYLLAMQYKVNRLPPD